MVGDRIQVDEPMQPLKWRILLTVHDHFPIRDELRHLLASYDDIEIIGEASDGIKALEVVAAHRPDVVLLDINMPNLNGTETVSLLRKWWTETEIIGLCLIQDAYITGAFLRAGAVAVISKDRLDHLHSTIQQACMNRRARLSA